MKRIQARTVVAVAVAALVSTPAPTGAVAGFGDVLKDTYYAAPVQWMDDNNITTGTGPCSFSPDDSITRGQAAAFIWRMEGRPRPAGGHPFVDVVESWQQDPVSWMYQTGVTTGTSPSRYSPAKPVTRGEFAVLLYRLAGEPPVPIDYDFTDVTTAWQRAAIAWMADRGITTGTTPTTFSPDAYVTRAQGATFLYRYKGSPRVDVTTQGDCYVLPGDGEWPVPGPVLGRRQIVNSAHYAVDTRDYGSPWYIHDVDIVSNGGNGLGPPDSGPGLIVNASIKVNDGADNVKISDGGVYRNLYLTMGRSGGHLDGFQGQGETDWLIDNVVIEMPTPHQGITAAVYIQNLRGGNQGYADVTGTINRLKIIGRGPYGADIRFNQSGGRRMTVTLTNVDWSQADPASRVFLSGNPSLLTVYLDDSVPANRISGADNATIIRI